MDSKGNRAPDTGDWINQTLVDMWTGKWDGPDAQERVDKAKTVCMLQSVISLQGIGASLRRIVSLLERAEERGRLPT